MPTRTAAKFLWKRIPVSYPCPTNFKYSPIFARDIIYFLLQGELKKTSESLQALWDIGKALFTNSVSKAYKVWELHIQLISFCLYPLVVYAFPPLLFLHPNTPVDCRVWNTNSSRLPDCSSTDYVWWRLGSVHCPIPWKHFGDPSDLNMPPNNR